MKNKITKKRVGLVALCLLLIGVVIYYNTPRFNIEDSKERIKANNLSAKKQNKKQMDGYVATVKISNKLKKSYVYDDVTDYILYNNGIGRMKAPSIVKDFSKPGQKILAGHRETVFNTLDEVKIGDVIEIEDYQNNMVFKYKVYDMFVIHEKETEKFYITTNKNIVTLETCWPVKAQTKNPTKRWIINSELISGDKLE